MTIDSTGSSGRGADPGCAGTAVPPGAIASAESAPGLLELRRPRLSPRLFAAIAVPYGVLGLLAAWVSYSLHARVGSVIRDGELTPVGAGARLWQLVTALLELVPWTLAAPWALVAGIGVCAAEGARRRVTVHAAWWWALRRPLAVLRVTGLLLVGLVGATVAPGAVVLVFPPFPDALALVLGGCVLLTLTGPYARLSNRCVERVLTPRGQDAVRRAAALREVQGPPLGLVLKLVVAAAVLQALVRMTHPEWFGWLGELVVAFAMVAAACLLVVAAVGDVLADFADGQLVTLPTLSRRPAVVPEDAIAAIAAVALLVGVVAPRVLVAMNTSDLVGVRTVESPGLLKNRADLVVLGDRVVLDRSQAWFDRGAVSCTDRECWAEPEVGQDAPVAAAASEGGASVWSAEWTVGPGRTVWTGEDVPVRLELTQSGTGGADWTGRARVDSVQVLHETTLFGVVSDRVDEHAVHLGWGDDGLVPAVATAPSGVVAVATAPDRVGVPRELMIWTCVSDSERSRAPSCRLASGQVHGLIPGRGRLDLAAADDGTAYAAAVLAGTDVVLYVADDGVLTERRIDLPGTDATDGSGPSSVAVVVDQRGTTWVLYRLSHEAEATLVRCASRTCETWDSIPVPGVPLAQGALAVDDTGRPMVVTSDPDDGVLRLLSCLDHACSESESVSLTAGRPVPGDGLAAPSLAVADGRPVILSPGDGLDSPGVLLRCEEARCGAA